MALLGRAPELVGVDPWFNTMDGEPLKLVALRGRVVLLEFWTFACGNCQRTLPFLRRMHGQYQRDLTVIGVHSPEFAFERSVQNVERAMQEHELDFPVGLDNEFLAWNAYGNQYWPTMYRRDESGFMTKLDGFEPQNRLRAAGPPYAAAKPLRRLMLLNRKRRSGDDSIQGDVR